MFFDQANFELAFLLRTREDATLTRWVDLLAGIFRGDAMETQTRAVRRLVSLRGPYEGVGADAEID